MELVSDKVFAGLNGLMPPTSGLEIEKAMTTALPDTKYENERKTYKGRLTFTGNI